MDGFVHDPPVEPQSGESQEAAPAQNVRSSGEESSGDTLVKTRRGHQVVPTNKDLPVVGPEGVKMSATDAAKVVAEYPEWAYIDKEGE